MHSVLIVEDKLIIALHLQKLLESNNYIVVDKLNYAEKVEEAVNNLNPDLIILDIMLEGEMNGIECAQELRKTHSTPIIFMSALTDSETEKDISSISDSIIMNKPLDEVILIDHIKSLLN